MLKGPALALLVLAAASPAAAAGEPAAAVDAAGGWMITSHKILDQRASGPALDVLAAAGWRTDAVTLGGVGGLLAAPILDEGNTGNAPARLFVLHAGGFATVALPRAPVRLTARLELTYGRLTGSILIEDGPPRTGTLASGLGGLASLGGSYDLALGRAQRLAVGLEATGGWVGRSGAGVALFAGLAFVGVRWE